MYTRVSRDLLIKCPAKRLYRIIKGDRHWNRPRGQPTKAGISRWTSQSYCYIRGEAGSLIKLPYLGFYSKKASGYRTTFPNFRYVVQIGTLASHVGMKYFRVKILWPLLGFLNLKFEIVKLLLVPVTRKRQPDQRLSFERKEANLYLE